jgi:CO/xanthine dehydrogenase Mo-binding subunit
MGNAVRLAAEHAREQVIAVAAVALTTEPEKLELRNAAVVSSTGEQLTLREIMLARFGMQAGNIIGIGSFTPTYGKPDSKTGQSANVTPFWMVGGTGAEIEVDTETGHIRVIKLINAGDVGCAINPEVVKRQLNGAGTMQMGFTLFEEMLLDSGQVINASLADCKIPGFLDLPDEIMAELIEVPHQRGPFGAKGMGETGTFAVSPAIANALYDAVGVRILEMPLTPEKVLRAIRKNQHRPLGNE